MSKEEPAVAEESPKVETSCSGRLRRLFAEILDRRFDRHPSEALLARLEAAVERRDYDLQDEAFIEKISLEGKDLLEDAFAETLSSLEGKASAAGEAMALPDDDRLVELFLRDVEKAIDYYYNLAISLQFSES